VDKKLNQGELLCNRHS